MSRAKAKRKLRAPGLEVGYVDRRHFSRSKGTVLKQGVNKGTELEPGSSVTLVVAAPYPRVPSVVGKSKASALRKLKDAGFKINKTTQTKTSGKDGVVLSQSRPGGTRAKPKSVVRIVISNVQRSSDAGGSKQLHPGLLSVPSPSVGLRLSWWLRQRTQIHRTRPSHRFRPVRPRQRR